jgi:predicted RNA binding protein YcfA (HicA-like mRNA interferase family)
MTAKELLRKLKKAGWTFQEGRRHTIAAGPDGTGRMLIHRHAGAVPVGTLKAVERETGISMRGKKGGAKAGAPPPQAA